MPAGDSREGQPGPATVGDELAGYRIESLVGRGGMGVVYRAYDLALDRHVALKLLAPELAGDVRFRERFLRESRIAASLDHPAIVPIYDAGEVGGQLYIAMRLVDGTDLKRLLAAKGALETEPALALLEQVADALDTAHERGLVHRDVKPSNVLVDERGHCYLADFGLSRHLTDQTTDLGAARSLGTVDYVAPEQIRGEELDGRADLYSLGCMLFECLAGRPPYGGSDTAVVFAHLQEEPPELPRLQPVLRKALAKERDDRYQSGRELIAAARGALRPARRRRLLLAALGAVAALTAVAGVALLARGSHGPTHSSVVRRTLPLEADRLNLIDASTRHVVGGVPAGRHNVTDVAFVGRSAWFSIPEESRLLRVDPRTRAVSKVVRLPWMPTDRIAAGGGLVWVREARNLGTLVLGVDGGSGRIVRRFDIGGSSIGISYGAGSLWLVGGGDIVRLDPQSGRVLHHFPAGADLLLYADGAVWAASNDGSVWKIDPVGNRITAHTKLHPFVSDLAVGDGALWVAVVGEDKVYRLSEDDLGVEQATPAGPDPERISAGDGAVWVANPSARALSRLASRSGARTQLATGAEPSTVRFHGGVVWVPAVYGLPPLPPIAGEQLRISTPYRFFNTDPASRVFPMDEQLTVATCARLLAYGPQGLRPEVAAAMPRVSRDGRTYTFRIRPGFRFSPPSNEPVTAATFRYTIERTLSPHSQAAYLAPEIVGLEAFESGRAKHISGITARGSRLSITLARPAGDLPARLALTVFCPVPLSTPLDPARVKGPIASDGPYFFSSAEGDRFVLLRNPSYEGHRPRRAARIVITDDVPTPKAVALVDNGQLDYLPEDFQGGTSLLGPLGELAALDGPGSPAARAGAQRLYFHTQPMVDTVVFNSKRPLFRNVRLRRAVEYALDRPAMAHAFFDAPAERLVQVPGYDRAGVYPLTGPDLRTARKLAGTKRRNAILLLPCDFGASGAAGILRSNLARIGITVRIDQFGSCSPTTIPRRFRTADMIIGTSLQCGPCERDPALFFTGVLHHGLWGGALPPGPWDAPAFTKRLERAAELRGRARVVAFTRLEDELARDAPFAIYGSFLYGEYFGRRVACRRFSAYSQGVDLGSLCVHAA